jgi:hypothetical protein
LASFSSTCTCFSAFMFPFMPTYADSHSFNLSTASISVFRSSRPARMDAKTCCCSSPAGIPS